jgi:hypothetical protein
MKAGVLKEYEEVLKRVEAALEATRIIDLTM